jgi:hypothetical protein
VKNKKYEQTIPSTQIQIQATSAPLTLFDTMSVRIERENIFYQSKQLVREEKQNECRCTCIEHLRDHENAEHYQMKYNSLLNNFNELKNEYRAHNLSNTSRITEYERERIDTSEFIETLKNEIAQKQIECTNYETKLTRKINEIQKYKTILEENEVEQKKRNEQLKTHIQNQDEIILKLNLNISELKTKLTSNEQIHENSLLIQQQKIDELKIKKNKLKKLLSENELLLTSMKQKTPVEFEEMNLEKKFLNEISSKLENISSYMKHQNIDDLQIQNQILTKLQKEVKTIKQTKKYKYIYLTTMKQHY